MWLALAVLYRDLGSCDNVYRLCVCVLQGYTVQLEGFQTLSSFPHIVMFQTHLKMDSIYFLECFVNLSKMKDRNIPYT